MFNFNIFKETKISGLKSIVGKSEITLPLLERQLLYEAQKRNNGKKQIWYGNTIKRIVSENSMLLKEAMLKNDTKSSVKV